MEQELESGHGLLHAQNSHKEHVQYMHNGSEGVLDIIGAKKRWQRAGQRSVLSNITQVKKVELDYDHLQGIDLNYALHGARRRGDGEKIVTWAEATEKQLTVACQTLLTSLLEMVNSDASTTSNKLNSNRTSQSDMSKQICKQASAYLERLVSVPGQGKLLHGRVAFGKYMVELGEMAWLIYCATDPVCSSLGKTLTIASSVENVPSSSTEVVNDAAAVSSNNLNETGAKSLSIIKIRAAPATAAVPKEEEERKETKAKTKSKSKKSGSDTGGDTSGDHKDHKHKSEKSTKEPEGKIPTGDSHAEGEPTEASGGPSESSAQIILLDGEAIPEDENLDEEKPKEGALGTIKAVFNGKKSPDDVNNSSSEDSSNFKDSPGGEAEKKPKSLAAKIMALDADAEHTVDSTDSDDDNSIKHAEDNMDL